MVRIVIVDDHALFRAGLVAALNRESDFSVVGEGVDGLDGIDRVRQLQPDVVLLDLHMPRCDGLQALPHMQTDAPNARIVILTESSAADDLYQAIKAGAHGYLLKAIQPEEIAEAIRDVAAGRSVISPAMAPILLDQFASLVKQQEPASGRLTARENEVLALLAQGRNNREIAQELTISENTVKNHVRNILDKLGLNSRMQAVAHALRENLVDLGRP